MIGNHGYQVILENILKGALNQTDVNITEVYVAMLDEVHIKFWCFVFNVQYYKEIHLLRFLIIIITCT